jgi:transketolase C-terminal domain/subunit
MRKNFSEYLKKIISHNKNVFILLGDISVGLFLDKKEKLYRNVLNLGLIEQSMISYAAGLARSGITPFVHTISPFMIERAYEQIKLDLSYNNCKCIMVSANGPFDYNKLGPTHHCPSDVPLLSLLENIEIFMPGRVQDVKTCIELSLLNSTSSYIRLNAHPVENENIASGTVICSGNIKESLNIYIGEALNLIDNNNLEFKKSDHLYVFSYNQIPKNLSFYKNIIFWEPYSAPVFAQKFRNERKSSQKIISNIYPNKIENGIFEFPPNYRETIV